MGYRWDIYGISMGYLWDIYGISMGQPRTDVKEVVEKSNKKSTRDKKKTFSLHRMVMRKQVRNGRKKTDISKNNTSDI